MATKMERLVKMANLLVKQKGEVKQAAEDLKTATALMFKMEREDMPSLMKELEVEQVRVKDGSTLTLTEDVSTSITEKTRARAIEWLIGHGFGGLIKTSVSVEFECGAHDKATKLRDQLAKKFEGTEMSEGVHASTLKAFVLEQMRAGKKLPMKVFNIFPFDKVVVKQPTKRGK